METNQVNGQLVTDLQDGYAGMRTRDGVIVVAIRDGVISREEVKRFERLPKKRADRSPGRY